MAKIIIKLENGAYNYYEDDVLTKADLPVRKVTRKDKDGNVTAIVGDIVLPKNPYGKNTISTTRFSDTITEYDLADATVRTTNGTKTTKSTKIDYSEHYTKEEAEKVKKHQDAIDKINAEVKIRVEREMTEKALLESAMSLSIEQLQALINAKTEAKA